MRLAAALSLALSPACALIPTPAANQPTNIAANIANHAQGVGSVEIRIRVAADSRQVMALDGLVAKVRFELTGTNVPNAPAVEVTREQFTNNRATVRWKDLLAGPVTAKATLSDSAGRVLARAQGDAVVEAGKTSTLDLTIVPETGSVTISADMTGLEPTSGLGASFGHLAAGSWQAAPPMAIPRAAHGAVMLAGNAFVVGGDFNDMLERFDPETWRWTPQFIPNDPSAVRAVGNAAVMLNRIVIVGRDLELGGKIEAASPIFVDPFAPAFDALDTDVGAFRPVPRYLEDLQGPRTGVGAVSDGNTLFMIGGSSRRANSRGGPYVFVTMNHVEALSARTGQWSSRAALPTARGALGAAWLGEKIYAAGGFRWKGTAAVDPFLGQAGIDSSDASQEAVDALEAYDTTADAWSTLAVLPTARYGLALVASKGRLYAIGGATGDGTPLATVESYDPAGNSWRAEPPLTTPRALLGAVALPDGTILATGGFGPGGTALRTTEAFLPEGQP